MMKQIIVFIALGVAFITSAQEWKQDYLETKVAFNIKNFGVTVDGNFSEVEIRTNFNLNQIEESYIYADINVKSISTGIKRRDNHILKKAYFDAENHQKIQLKSSKIEKNKNGTFSLLANLVLKGITKKITIPLQIIETKNSLKITSTFTINRKDFKISGGGFVLSDLVTINVTFKGTK